MNLREEVTGGGVVGWGFCPARQRLAGLGLGEEIRYGY